MQEMGMGVLNFVDNILFFPLVRTHMSSLVMDGTFLVIKLNKRICR